MPFESAEFDKMGWSFVRVVSVSEFSRVKEDDPSCRTPEETSLHAGTEGFQFAYQMLYLLDATGYYSLALHALGIHVCRASGQELTLQGALLSCTYTVLDYAQTGLIAAVFFFKVAKEGVQLPPDRTVCPLCLQKRVNPSVITVSGFVFCYACVFKFVTQYKRCPATMMPATVDQIRRLFHDV
ncbi:ubiquitin-protein ligase peroxin 12 [Lathyrus oleraceus]|uniref:Peroxin-12 n=1 Tax=Pisum sativum TaxID=3888 RepID=A0A9D4X3G0_PEA|nr:ubiquitin-protein ligase peroxin 12 [Pisum sativum]